MPGRGHALTIDSGWRAVAETALGFVRRFADPESATLAPRPRTSHKHAGKDFPAQGVLG